MAETLELKKRPALSGRPMVLGWMAMIIFAFHASTHMVGAGDTWVAMACGRHFLNHGVDTVEPFSANSHRAGPTEEDIAKLEQIADVGERKSKLDQLLDFLGANPIQKIDKAFREKYEAGIIDYLDLNG